MHLRKHSAAEISLMPRQLASSRAITQRGQCILQSATKVALVKESFFVLKLEVFDREA